MSTGNNASPKADVAEPGSKEGMMDEEEVFRSLGHKARRDIIKIIGKEQQSTFSAIKKAIGNIESPALAYHLKSLQPLLVQKEGAYALSEIGIAASKLLSLTSDSARVALGKRKFTFAYITTVACWIAAESIIPFLIDPGVGNVNFIIYQVVINAISITNFIMIWRLRQSF
jgi:DNA-binding transcriptional ArsR family regulator